MNGNGENNKIVNFPTKENKEEKEVEIEKVKCEHDPNFICGVKGQVLRKEKIGCDLCILLAIRSYEYRMFKMADDAQKAMALNAMIKRGIISPDGKNIIKK